MKLLIKFSTNSFFFRGTFLLLTFYCLFLNNLAYGQPLQAHSVTGEIPSIAGLARLNQGDATINCIDVNDDNIVKVSANFYVKSNSFKETNCGIGIFKNGIKEDITSLENFQVKIETQTGFFEEDIFLLEASGSNARSANLNETIVVEIEFELNKYPWWQFWRRNKFRPVDYSIVFQIDGINLSTQNNLTFYDGLYAIEPDDHKHLEVLKIPICVFID